MRPVPLAFGALLVSIAATFVLEVREPSMIVDFRVTAVQFEVRMLREAILQYKTSFGELPVSLDQLVSSGVMGRLPDDRWGNHYIYKQTKSEDGFVVYSPGLDTIDQDGGGDDVVTGEKKYECDVYGTNCPLKPVEWGKLLSAVLFVLSFVALIGMMVIRLVRWCITRNAT